MMKKTILFLFVMIFLIGSLFAEGNQPTSQYNKIFLNPFYRASMTSNTNYTYTLNINPPDKLSSVSSAIIQIDTYLTPTVNYNLWVNGKACNNPTFTVSTTYAGASQGTLYFDCSNVITQAGTYTITLRADKNSGSSTAWIDLTYTNSPKGELILHGTEYSFGQVAKSWLQLLDNNGTEVNQGVCYVTIFSPTGTVFLDSATMTNQNRDGLYYYDIDTMTMTQGVFPTLAKCYYQAGQTYIFPNNITMFNGTLDTGDVSRTFVLDGIYMTTSETTSAFGSPRRYWSELNFTGNVCNNISSLLLKGITISWTGRWNSNVANDIITISIWNYTSNSWIALPNTITGSGTGAKSVSNSFSFSNITQVGLVNSSGSNLRLKFQDTALADTQSTGFDYDYLSVSCDQLSSSLWTEVKGSSEIHITSDFPFIEELQINSYTINNTQTTTLWNGSVIEEIYYTGIFKHQFSISSVTKSTESVSIEYQGLHSIPCNAIISFFYVNDTGYYPYPYKTQRQTEEDHCSINFDLDIVSDKTYDFEAHARNSWESDIRSTNTGLGSIYPLLDGGCTLWQIVKGYPPYIVPKNQTNEQRDYYYRACGNFYDNFYWFNQTYHQALIDKNNITDEKSYAQYESDYVSMKFAEDKLNVVTNYLLNNLQAVNDYSQLLIANPLGDSVVNTTDQRYWAEKSTLYQAWKIVNDSCGTGICKIDGSSIDFSNVSITATVNTTEISNAVWSSNATVSTSLLSQFVNAFWNYTGTINPLILSQITVVTVDAVWNYTGTISTPILSQISDTIWTRQDRNLTYYELSNQTDLTNYTLIQEMINNQTDLTNYTLIQQTVWENLNRSLTEFNFDVVNETEIANQVWSSVSRTLTEFNFTINATVDINNTAIADAVWSAVNRTLSDYNQTSQLDLTDYNKIQTMVWNNTVRELTGFNFTVNTTATQTDLTNYTLIQEMVWSATQRTLTEFNFTVDVNQTLISDAVWSAVNRTLSEYNQSDLTDYNKIQTMVWNNTVRTLTEFNITVNATVDSQAIAGAVWNYTNKTVDFATTGSTDNVSIVENIKDIGQVYLGGTEYIDGDAGKVVIRLVRGTGALAEIELGATCIISLTYPNQTYFVNNAPMTELGDGVYYYDFTVPALVGVYTYYSNCNISDRNYYGLETFHVYQTNYSGIPKQVWEYGGDRNLTYYPSIDTVNYTLIQQTVWENLNRSLTEFNFDVVNETEISDAVWQNVQRTLTEFNFTVDVNQTMISDAIWSAVNRSLTDYNQTDLTDYNKIQTMVWNSTTRELTLYPTSNLTASQIWNYQDGRNLTYYPTVDVTNLTVTINNSAVAEAVWSYNGTINPNIIIQFANDIECQLSKWFNLEEGWGVNIPNC